jgi:hypothetical protein
MEEERGAPGIQTEKRNSSDRGLPLVRWQHPRGIPTTSEALEGTGETRQRFRECLLARLFVAGLEERMVSNDGVRRIVSLICLSNQIMTLQHTKMKMRSAPR